MKGKIRWLLAPLVILALLLCAVPAHASIPTMPHPFYGTVTIGGSAAPVGTEITAKVAGVECGSYTTTVEGQYGSSDPYQEDSLIVQGDIESGAEISFYVDGADTTQTYAFSPGASLTELNLTVTVVDNTPPTVTIDDIADYVNVLAQISGTASDNVALDKVQVSIENTIDSVFWNGTDWSSATEVWLDATGTEAWT